MKAEDFLREVTALPGVTGNEGAVARYIADAFAPYADEVRITPLHCVIAHKKGPGPKVMICAHLDEIGMMVSKIEEDGCLRLERVGGVDPRVLPGMRVRVYTRLGVLMGVVGATPPHLLRAEERKNNYTFDNLYVDMGMPADKVRQTVRVGDTVCFEARYVPLKNGRVATKTADDRACVTIMLEAAKRLQGMRHKADLYFVATCQEEIGSYGALAAGFELAPDYGVAFDVCHADTPGAPKNSTSRIDSLVSSKGPFIQPFLEEKLEACAKNNGVELQIAVENRDTSTDADELSTTRAGVPTVLLSLPIKYMHTNVETLDMHALTEGARLLAHYLADVDESWEEALWI
ncbi:MAG: M20/M25/M40 family metallo-hydrolase [Clostridia bacterium]|nr:M20/M25/M40 family metallo-hydrolase [Clostridia bacterium]